ATLVCGGGGNGTLHLCTVGNKSLRVRQVLSKHTKAANGIAFAPDGATFVTTGDDAAAHAWDAGGGKHVNAWSDLRFPIPAAAYAPDGRHLAFANANSTIYLLRLGKNE